MRFKDDNEGRLHDEVEKVWAFFTCYPVLFLRNSKTHHHSISATCWLRWEIALISRLRGADKPKKFVQRFFSFLHINKTLPMSDGGDTVSASHGARLSVRRRRSTGGAHRRPSSGAQPVFFLSLNMSPAT